MAVLIDYEVTGIGWAECTVTIGFARETVTASYLSDALGELARAALEVLDGAEEVRFSFDEEPGEYRWILRRVGDTVSVTIRGFPQTWSNAPDAGGAVVLQGECTANEFAEAVLRAMNRVLAAHGLVGYRQKWDPYDFPEARRAALRARLQPADADE